IQTGKVLNFPVVLFDTQYWRGLREWLEAWPLAQGKIAKEDLDLLLWTDSPGEARDFIVAAMQELGWRQQQEEGARQKTREALSAG
ncbi:MAG: TIGR00730 family Rossman fold protein, partial [Candidatus Promineifilaceae bacterium]